MIKSAAALKEKINEVRKIIKAANSKLSGRIKWDVPSYYYKDRWLVHFKDKADAEKNKKELSMIINEIVKTIDNSN